MIGTPGRQQEDKSVGSTAAKGLSLGERKEVNWRSPIKLNKASLAAGKRKKTVAATQLSSLRAQRVIPGQLPELQEDEVRPRRRGFWRAGPRRCVRFGWARCLPSAQLAPPRCPAPSPDPARATTRTPPNLRPLASPRRAAASSTPPPPTPSRAAARPTSPLGAHDALLLQHERGPVHQARHHGHAQAERYGGGARAARPLPGRRRCRRCSPHSAGARLRACACALARRAEGGGGLRRP